MASRTKSSTSAHSNSRAISSAGKTHAQWFPHRMYRVHSQVFPELPIDPRPTTIRRNSLASCLASCIIPATMSRDLTRHLWGTRHPENDHSSFLFVWKRRRATASGGLGNICTDRNEFPLWIVPSVTNQLFEVRHSKDALWLQNGKVLGSPNSWQAPRRRSSSSASLPGEHGS